MRQIQYGITADGDFISRVDSEVAWPVLDYEGMKPENKFAERYDLQKFSVHAIGREWNGITWTKKIPIEAKNLHRKFWGFKPLTREPNKQETIGFDKLSARLGRKYGW